MSATMALLNYMRILISILSLLHTCRAFDSEGSDFWTAFIANRPDGTPGQNSLIFFNDKDVDSDVTVFFRNLTEFVNQPLTSLSTTVPTKSGAITLVLPDYLTYVGSGAQFLQIAPIGIQITASSPVRVFGQSAKSDGTSGDLFLILPTSALGKAYVVALNEQSVPHNFGSNVIVVATQNRTTASFTPEVLNAGDVWMITSSTEDSIVTSFSADRPLAVIAGSQCSGFAQSLCDYRVFMPLPTRCNSIQAYLDNHPVLNLQSVTNTYTIAPECGTGSSFQVDGITAGRLDIGPVLNYQFPLSQINNTHLISVGDPQKPVQVTRTNPVFGGNIVVPVLSDSQYVNNELVNFFVPQADNNFVQIIADTNSRNTATLDNLSHPEWIWSSVPNIIGPTFYITTININTGSHIFEASGLFTITVFGYGTNKYTYAYVPALNTGQQDVLTTIPTTTTSKITTTIVPTTTKQTTTTQISRSSAIPTVSVATTQQSAPTANQPRQCACTYSKLYLDIVIVSDSSNGVQQGDFNGMNGFFFDVISRLTVSQSSPNTSRIGLVVFNNNGAVIVANLSTFDNASNAAIGAINMPFLNGVGGNVASGLAAAQAILQNRTGARSKNPAVVILASSVGDNCQDQKLEREDSPCRIANNMKQNGITIITIAYKFPEGSGANVMHIASPCKAFINQDNIRENVLKSLCDANCVCPYGVDNDWKMWNLVKDDTGCKKTGECVYLVSTASSWQAGYFTCKNTQGSSIVDVFSMDKQQFLDNLTNKTNLLAVPYWIGLNDQTQTGQYSWSRSDSANIIKAQPNDYINWAIGFPNDSNGTNTCVMADKSFAFSNKWKNADCNESAYHVCQLDSCDSDNYCS